MSGEKTYTVKAGLFGFLREQESNTEPGKTVYARSAASFGEKVTTADPPSNPEPRDPNLPPEPQTHYNVAQRSIDRGLALDAFYTDADYQRAALLQQLQAEAGMSQAELTAAVGAGSTLPPHLMSVPNAVPDSALAAGAGQGAGVDTATLDADKTAAYIKLYEPNVSDTVDLAGGDPERAKVVLEAEAIATGNDPRVGVVKGLEAVVAAGNQ